jgi:hypothetical protein
VSSLNGKELYRVRVWEGRAVVAEPLSRRTHLCRMRDMVELPDATIAIKNNRHKERRESHLPAAPIRSQCAVSRRRVIARPHMAGERKRRSRFFDLIWGTVRRDGIFAASLFG